MFYFENIRIFSGNPVSPYSIVIQCAMKDGNKVEVEHLPRLSEFSQVGQGYQTSTRKEKAIRVLSGRTRLLEFSLSF